MKRIYKTKWGQVIDLEQLVTFMLTDKTLDIVYKGGMEQEYAFKHKDCDCDKSGETYLLNKERFDKRIKSEVDELGKAWAEYGYIKSNPVNINYSDDNIILTDWNSVIKLNNDAPNTEIISKLRKLHGISEINEPIVEYIIEASKDGEKWEEQSRFKKGQRSRFDIPFNETIAIREAKLFRLNRAKDGLIYVRLVIPI